MKNLLPLLTFACVLSCQTNGDEVRGGDARPAPPAPDTLIDVINTKSMIGQPLEKVQAACDAAEVPHRVIEVDGESRMVTRDFRPERLNFKVKGGVVAEVTKG
jgi:hypothetical protein